MSDLLYLIASGFYVYWVYWCVRTLVIMRPSPPAPMIIVIYTFFSMINPFFVSIYIYFRHYH